MTLLLPDAAIGPRRGAVRGPLAALAGSLRDELQPLLLQPPAPDPRKARMTRVGGRCAREGALLAFDPFDPGRHRCPVCGAEYRGEAHERWWVMWHHLWLAERAVHGAVLALLCDDPESAALSVAILERSAALYLAYPNRDNVLGPSRPFFSTYLESIWLLQLCVALDAIEASRPAERSGLGARVRERLVAPSLALIESYPEPGSNRQVWNAAARMAAHRLLGDADGMARAFDGEHGVLAQLGGGLLADGSWYEGENYHQFAHRGLWYGISLAEAAGLSVPAPLLARFHAGFAAPFQVALPDFTLPARRDSQHAISLRQWRYAESCELGLARGDDPRLCAALARLYDDDVPRRDTGRWRSAAESERNEPASALTRADLGWRALLHARPERAPAARWAPGTVHLPAQGLAVFRRDAGRLWVGFDYGHAGGSHGHPDRLNLMVVDGPTRWLDDMGTGSYVERALHWYRSTLAHQAPLVDGASQPRADGMLLGLADSPGVSGAAAAARLAPDVTATRAVVVDGTCVLDWLRWEAGHDAVLDLPYHVDGDAALAPTHAPLTWRRAERAGAGGLEDGFDFLDDVECATAPEGAPIRLALRDPGETQPSIGAALWLLLPPHAELWRARAPGPPGGGARRFHAVRLRGRRGALTGVVDVRGALAGVQPLDDAGVRLLGRDGTSTEHRPPAGGAGGWRVRRDGADEQSSLEVATPPSAWPEAPSATASGPDASEPLRLRAGRPWTRELADPHYRRSEESWVEAGRPTARVDVYCDRDELTIDVTVLLDRATTFVPAGAENALDNERPEVNGDGVELFVVPSGGSEHGRLAGWLLVPDAAGAVRVLPTTPAASALPLDARAEVGDGGYRVAVRLPRAAVAAAGGVERARAVGLDVLVNEMPAGRERRRGQLVLSGARGGFVYLQGDRHDAARCVPVVLPPLADR